VIEASALPPQGPVTLAARLRVGETVDLESGVVDEPPCFAATCDVDDAWLDAIASSVMASRPVTVVTPPRTHMPILRAVEQRLGPAAAWRLTFVTGFARPTDGVLVRMASSAAATGGTVMNLSSPAPTTVTIPDAPPDPVATGGHVVLEPPSRTWPLIWLVLLVLALGLLAVFLTGGWTP